MCAALGDAASEQRTRASANDIDRLQKEDRKLRGYKSIAGKHWNGATVQFLLLCLVVQTGAANPRYTCIDAQRTPNTGAGGTQEDYMRLAVRYEHAANASDDDNDGLGSSSCCGRNQRYLITRQPPAVLSFYSVCSATKPSIAYAHRLVIRRPKECHQQTVVATDVNRPYSSNCQTILFTPSMCNKRRRETARCFMSLSISRSHSR